MRRGVKGFVGWLAIVAIALHTVLWGALAPMAAVASAVDPLSIICSSSPHAAAQTEEAPTHPALKPTAACDHCSLCSATSPPAVAPDNVIAGQLTPSKRLLVVYPAPLIPRGDAVSNPKLSQGPPSKT
jgi:hypothetical protein